MAGENIQLAQNAETAAPADPAAPPDVPWLSRRLCTSIMINEPLARSVR